MVEQNKKYDHAEAIRQQIRFVNESISGMKGDEKEDFKDYFNRCFMGVSSLEAMIAPFGYESSLQGKNPMNMKRSNQLGLLVQSMREIYSFLHDNELFYTTFNHEELGEIDKQAEQEEDEN